MLIRWNKKGRWVQGSLLSPQGFESFHSDLPRARWFNIVYVWSVCRWLSQWWFLFYCGLMLLWVMGVGFDNTCAVSGKWNVSRVIPRLYGWVYKTFRLSPLVVEHSFMVVSARLNPKGSQFFIPVLWNLCSESLGHKILRPSWGLRHWRSAFIYS